MVGILIGYAYYKKRVKVKQDERLKNTIKTKHDEYNKPRIDTLISALQSGTASDYRSPKGSESFEMGVRHDSG